MTKYTQRSHDTTSLSISSMHFIINELKNEYTSHSFSHTPSCIESTQIYSTGSPTPKAPLLTALLRFTAAASCLVEKPSPSSTSKSANFAGILRCLAGILVGLCGLPPVAPRVRVQLLTDALLLQLAVAIGLYSKYSSVLDPG